MEGEIVGVAPEKVKAVEVSVSPLYVPAVMFPPVVTLRPPEELIESVPVPLPMTVFPVPVPTFVAPLPELFRFAVPVRVSPPVP